MNLVKATITEAYLTRFLSAALEPVDEGFLISRKTTLGKFIFSLIEPADRPQKEGNVTFVIPEVNDFDYNNVFIHIPKEKQLLLNDFLDSYFSLTFHNFLAAARCLSADRTKAVDLFVSNFNLTYDVISYDSLAKKDFRFRERAINLIREMMIAIDTKANKKFYDDLSS